MTPRGFEVWMFTQLMTAPQREWTRISKILDHWTLFENGVEMPKVIPRECFPRDKDHAIYEGWWQAVGEDYPEEDLDSDDERKVPLGLPEPDKRRPRSYSVRNGESVHDSVAGDDYKESLPPGSARGAMGPRPFKVPDPSDFLTQIGRASCRERV